MDAAYDRYDSECRARYGIAPGPDAEMSDDQAGSLIACRSALPAAEVGAWPPADAATELARAAAGPVHDFARLAAQFRWMWDRGPRAGPSRAAVHEASGELLARCGGSGSSRR